MTEKNLKNAFDRFKVMAWLTGVVLAFLTLVAIPYKYIFHFTGHWTSLAWMAHGWLYLIYFIVTLALALDAKWSWKKSVLLLLAGTVPFMSFVAERKVRAELGF